MQEIKDILHQTTATGEKVLTLMKAATILIGLSKAKVRAVVATDDASVAVDQLGELATDAGHLCLVAMEINKTVVDMVSTTSAAATSALALLQRQEGAQPWAETTAATFRESLKALEGIEQVMRQNEQQAAACIDKLHDIAMRGGAPADVVATVDALLLRMRKYRAGG